MIGEMVRLIMKKDYLLKLCIGIVPLLTVSCNSSRKLTASANQSPLAIPALATAHTGVCVMDLSTGQYLYNYQGDKYFIPASNMKLLTCYAAMKYLGDSLDGIEVIETPDALKLLPTGDPTLLHPDFAQQPVFTYLSKAAKPLQAAALPWKENAWGSGWSWSDYEAEYMAERSALPIYGNVLTLTGSGADIQAIPRYFTPVLTGDGQKGYVKQVQRQLHENRFTYTATGVQNKPYSITFITSDSLNMHLLADTLHKPIQWLAPAGDSAIQGPQDKRYVIHSRPVDSLLRIMMHRSDNFYAEQTLLMAGRKRLNDMRTAPVIQAMLEQDYKGMPQQPRWVDGSGLSRYNLVTPQDFVWLLAQMKASFSWERITGILQTGDAGTLTGYYKAYAGRIYAKTGTLSNNIALSGYLITRKNKVLAFSVLVNNHQAPTGVIRRGVEQFLTGLIEKY
jgi:D-alanyl-D-alanine carboxypeptidase/D-alanyl-D-alanine-endopeptidase (penicillin-binding protein 4)